MRKVQLYSEQKTAINASGQWTLLFRSSLVTVSLTDKKV